MSDERNFAVGDAETPPRALQTSECNELLDPTRTSCLILVQRQPGKLPATHNERDSLHANLSWRWVHSSFRQVELGSLLTVALESEKRNHSRIRRRAKRLACALARRFTLSQNGYGAYHTLETTATRFCNPLTPKSQQHPRVFPNGPPIQY